MDLARLWKCGPKCHYLRHLARWERSMILILRLFVGIIDGDGSGEVDFNEFAAFMG